MNIYTCTMYIQEMLNNLPWNRRRREQLYKEAEEVGRLPRSNTFDLRARAAELQERAETCRKEGNLDKESFNRLRAESLLRMAKTLDED